MLPIKINLPEDFLKEEIRCNYTVSKQMKEVWAVELDLLQQFDRLPQTSASYICRRRHTVRSNPRKKALLRGIMILTLLCQEKIMTNFVKSLRKRSKNLIFFNVIEQKKGYPRRHAQFRKQSNNGYSNQ